MKHYELIIEEKQPTCGGRTPTKTRILEVDTDDPIAYVKNAERTDEVEIEKETDGEIIIRVQRGEYGYWVKYGFTEE